MNTSEFRENAHRLVDWMADYLDHIGDYPVSPAIQPGDIKNQLPRSAPESAESFDALFEDFKNIIMPGMTHWQHPQFYAYFPTGASKPSILAEMLSSTLGAQCMIWLTSPAAEELEERMMEWLREMLGLPQDFVGVIQDTASTATLVALLTARERRSDYGINQRGFNGQERFRIYASSQVHSSIDKAVRIAGFGIDNLVKIDTDEAFAMQAEALEAAIQKDVQAGFTPLCVVATLGTTSSTAIDPLTPIGAICRKYDCWLHVDAAYGGAALILPEMRGMSEGLELADSFLFNPHKWLFTNFDCTAYFVRDKKALINTFSILPEYLKTPHDQLVNNYRDWGIQLGRRFRALKLWFVIRTMGVEQMQNILRTHLKLAQWLVHEIEWEPDFELLAPVPFNLICFRYHPRGVDEEARLDDINRQLLESLNASGKILLTQTKLNGRYTIRFVAGQIDASLDSVKKGWDMIRDAARQMKIVL